MYLTTRATLLLLLAALPIVAATWLPALRWLAPVYVILLLILVALDWRLAKNVEQFSAARDHDSKLSLGADNPITLTIRNRRASVVQIWIRDEAPDAFQIDQRIIQAELPPRAQVQERYFVRPLARGDYAFGNINLRWSSPLGLVVRQGRLLATSPVRVYPNLLDVRRYDLLLRRNRLQEMGLRPAQVYGQGTEFARLREYTPDDDYRRINWKATARKRRPISTEFQTERSQNVMLVLDTGRMMKRPVDEIAKLDYVVNALLLLTYVASGTGDRVGLLTFADDVGTYLTPRPGRSQFYRMLELLYAVEAQAVEPDYRRALTYLARKQRKRSLVVLFTDLSSGYSMKALQESIAILARRHLPVVVTISDPDIHSAASARPRDSGEVYRQMVAGKLLEERRVVIEGLNRRGVTTLDAPANGLSFAVIQRYLDLKSRQRL